MTTKKTEAQIGLEWLQTRERDERYGFVICFLHDHLKEVMRIQCKVIENSLLGLDFVSADTVSDLRTAAAVYLDYATKIEHMLEGQDAFKPN